MRTPTETRWITGRACVGTPRLRLVCLPQAGGGAGAFSRWRSYLSPGVELAPVELPARGTRSEDPMPATLDDLVDQLFAGVTEELTMPYAIFGHSFGGVIAYELTRRIEAAGLRRPEATLISASRAPHIPLEKGIADSDDKTLLRWLIDNGGLPLELLRFKKFLRHVMSAIRVDLVFAEGYLLPAPVPVETPLHTFAGADDKVVTADRVRPWQECAASEYSFTVLPGDHTFPHADPAPILERVTVS